MDLDSLWVQRRLVQFSQVDEAYTQKASAARNPYLYHFGLGLVGLAMVFVSVVLYVVVKESYLPWLYTFLPFCWISIVMAIGATMVCPAMYAYSQILRRRIVGVVTVMTPILAWLLAYSHWYLLYEYYLWWLSLTDQDYYFVILGIIGGGDIQIAYLVHFWAWVGWGLMTIGWGLVFLLTQKLFERHFMSFFAGVFFIAQGIIHLLVLDFSACFGTVPVLLALACVLGAIVFGLTVKTD